MTIDAEAPAHGAPSRSIYNRGCRCAGCKAVVREYSRVQRQRRLQGLVAPVGAAHGTYYRYNNFGCRCDACRAANRDRQRSWERQREQAAARQRFPLQPLLDRLDGSLDAVVRRLGVDRRQLYRWLKSGVTAMQADELACRAGMHASSVWADW